MPSEREARAVSPDEDFMASLIIEAVIGRPEDAPTPLLADHSRVALPPIDGM